MAIGFSNSNPQPSSSIIPVTRTPYIGNDIPALCDMKILCTQKKKKSKWYSYLTFVESCSLSSANEQPCIEIHDKTSTSSILLDDCISFESFDTTKNDYQSFIYVYFQSKSISISFLEEQRKTKAMIVKYLEHLYEKKSAQSKESTMQQSLQDVPCQSTTEHILHTFDIKLIPFDTIITRDHPLVGPARVYFTTTDLYIASRDCNQIDLKTAITNQCPLKNKEILCIPYYTIRHYGNRLNLFLIELGKSDYGNGEIRMKCLSSSLASTIHLLVGPVIEEKPLILCSAFRDQLLTRKRAEKAKDIHPPIQLNANPAISISNNPAIGTLPELSTVKKSRSFFGLFRTVMKSNNSLPRSCTTDEQQQVFPQPFANKYFVLDNSRETILQEPKSKPLGTNKDTPVIMSNEQETTIENYFAMGLPVQQSKENLGEERIISESTATVDVGVNTEISLSPHVRSAFIVGNCVHLITEERAISPIGQRFHTLPASVMQPFKAQLSRQTNNTSTGDPNNSNSTYQLISPIDPHQSLLLCYGTVTFNCNSLLTNQPDGTSDSTCFDDRLNSDLSLIPISPQEQPSTISSLNNMLSASSNSHIFRTLGDNTAGRFYTSNGSVTFFEENFSDPATSYLLESPSITFTENWIPTKSIAPSYSLRFRTKKQQLLDDSYALIEPVITENSSVSSLPTISIKGESSVHYTDILFSSNSGDKKEESPSSDDQINDGKDARSSTISYTDIDFQQTQRRNRIAQFAAISNSADIMPPFVL